MQDDRRKPLLRFGIALFDGVEELDWVGPWEVLTTWAQDFPDDGVEVISSSRVPGTVHCAKGARVLADCSWSDCPPLDVLIYPGGPGTRSQLSDDQVRSWVRARAQTTRVVASVCTGSLVLADAGLLDGRPATTHWRSLELLRELGNGIEVRPGERFVDDDTVITAAGVSAGIDMALHLVGRFASVGRAREVGRTIQYEAVWGPGSR